jgi:hypothetical protein
VTVAEVTVASEHCVSTEYRVPLNGDPSTAVMFVDAIAGVAQSRKPASSAAVLRARAQRRPLARPVVKKVRISPFVLPVAIGRVAT